MTDELYEDVSDLAAWAEDNVRAAMQHLPEQPAEALADIAQAKHRLDQMEEAIKAIHATQQTYVHVRLLVETCDLPHIRHSIREWYDSHDAGMDDIQVWQEPAAEQQASGQAQSAGLQSRPSDPEAAEAARE